MNRYITKDIVRLHPPGVVQLTKEQATPRLHLLNEVDVEQGVYELKGDVEFKRGEEFGYEGDPPKGLTSAMGDPDAADDELDHPQEDATDVVDDDKIARIMDAIDGLDPETDDFTDGGKPQVKAIEALLDEDITAAERDIAWQQVQEARKADGE